MTLNQLTSEVYRELPLFARLVASRRRVDRIVRCAMMARPENYAFLARGDVILRRDCVAHYRDKVGNPLIWMWLISIVISLIWQWWLSRRTKGIGDLDDLLELHLEAKA